MTNNVFNTIEFTKYPFASLVLENSRHNEDFCDATRSLIKLIKEDDYYHALCSDYVQYWDDTPQGYHYWDRIVISTFN